MTVAAEPSRTETNVSRSRRGPRGRLRARLAGLAAVFGVFLGALSFPAAAQAADFNAWISGGNDQRIDIGGAAATITVQVQATFQPGQGPKDTSVSASLSGLDGLASIDVADGPCFRSNVATATCQAMTSGETREIQFTVAPMAESDLPEGETKTGEVKINFDGGNQKTSVTVAGNAKAGIGSISGTVTSNATPVDGAKVVLRDGEGTNHEQSTDSSGNFLFDGGGNIAPGDMTLTVTAEGFEELVEEFNVAQGGTFTRNMTLTPVQTEEATSAAPTTQAVIEEPSPSVAAQTEEEGGVSGTLVFLIIVGALLVIGGIVGIVFLLRGGKDDDKDDEAESFSGKPTPEHTPTAAQVGSPGVYQAGPAPGQDAPTMVHNGPLVQDNEVGAYGAPTSAFGPAYGPGSNDSTQVMPQANPPGAPPPPPPVGPNDTQILSTVKGLDKPGSIPPPPMGDATHVMPRANMGERPQQPTFSDPGATQPYQAPTPPPPPVSRDPYAPPPSQPPQYQSQSQPPQPPQYQSQPPQPSQPSQPPQSHFSDPGATRPYTGQGGQGVSRDPYAPPSRPAGGPPAEPYSPQPTQAMPQAGAPGTPPSPYAPEQAEDEGSTNSHRRGDEERRGWGEWDDRPRSW